MQKRLSLIIAACLAFAWTGRCLTVDDYIAQGRASLVARDFNAANLSFSNAVVKAPTNATANVFRGVTRILALPNQAACSNFLNLVGVSKTGRNIADWTATFATNGDGSIQTPSINANQATALLHDSILVDWLGADANLAVADANFTLALSADETGSRQVTLDYADIQLIRAGLQAGAVFIYTTHAWNLDAQIDKVVNTAQSAGLSGIVSNFQHLLTLQSGAPADLAAAKTAFQSGANIYLTASQLIRSRPADDSHLFNWDDSMASSEEKFRFTLIDLANSLTGPVTLTENPNYTVNAGQFFNPTNAIRSMLPTFGRSGFVLGTLPDPTFGGVVTGLSRNQIENDLSSKLHPLLRAPGVTLTEVCQFTNTITEWWDQNNSGKLLQMSDGSWYLVSPYGGAVSSDSGDDSGTGAIYKISATGALSTVATFDDNSLAGTYPNSLLEGNDGNLYGTTTSGGDNYFGTFFSLSPATKKITVLGSFLNSQTGLTKGADGNFYGLANDTFFQANTNGISEIAGLGISNAGSFSPLTLGKDGNFYGTFTDYSTFPASGGAFMITPLGQATLLSGTINGQPCGTLVQDSNGNFYGVSQAYWDDNTSTMSVFKITPDGQINSYDLFDYTASGRFQAQDPVGVALNAKGNLIIAASNGGGSGKGVILQTTIFDNDSTGGYAATAPLVWFEDNNGAYPSMQPIMGKDGSFYGLTAEGSAHGYGSLYKLSETGIPRILSQPEDFIAQIGTDDHLSVAAVGDPPLQYQWFKNGVPISGATNQDIEFTNVVATDAASYQIVVKNALGSAPGDVFQLIIGVPPAFSQCDTNPVAVIGGSLVLKPVLTGTGPFSYQWLHNGMPIMPNGNPNISIQNGTLDLSMVTSNDLGSYQLVAFNQYGTTPSPVMTLATAQPVSIQIQPASQRVAATSNVTFSVSASGSGSLSYHWLKNGVSMANSSRISGVTNAALTIKMLTTNDSGNYSVIVNNSVGALHSSNATLVVFSPDTQKPLLTLTYPKSTVRVSNEDLTVSGAASDNIAVAGVFGIVTASGSSNRFDAPPVANWSNWTAKVTLVPGVNQLTFYSIDTSSNLSKPATVTVTYIKSAALTLSTNGVGAITPYANGQLLAVGSNYTITARAGGGYLFSNWSGSVSSASNVLTFKMQTNSQLVANFVPNPFPSLAGTYNGLFYNSNAIALESSGSFNATIQTNGIYTVKLMQGTTPYSYKGQFSLEQSVAVPSGKNPALTMQLDKASGGTITGTVTNNGFASGLLAYRNPYFQSSSTSLAGKYTLAVAESTPAAQPTGYGSIALSLAANGTLTVSGYAADGGTLSQGTSISGTGLWPFYSTVSTGGALLGWQSIGGSTNPTGWIDWLKPANSALHQSATAYLSTDLTGSAYTNKSPLLGINNGFMAFSGAGLSHDLTNKISLSGSAIADVTKTNRLSLKLIPASGLFSGSIVNPATKKTMPFTGVLLQQQDTGVGAFQNTNQTGVLQIKPD